MKVIKLILIFSLISLSKCESLCDCGNFIDLKVTTSNNKFHIDLQPLKDFLSNRLIEGHRLYVVGNYGEIDVLSGVILNEMYENYKSINSPDCLVHKSKFSSLLGPNCTSITEKSSSVQLWNDIFLYETQGKMQIALIFINFKAQPGQSQFESRILSAFSGLLSSVYIVLGEESFYNEYFGKDAQECDFNFHINELDQRNEIDESILEIHSILSHQNIEMHEGLHFAREDLKIDNFFNLLDFGVERISEIEDEKNSKLVKFIENLKKFVDESKTFEDLCTQALSSKSDEFHRKILQSFKEEAINIYMELVSKNYQIPNITSSKIQRKKKIFVKKLKQMERIVTSKIQTFITEISENLRKFLESSGNAKILSTKESQLISFGDVKFGENIEDINGPQNEPIDGTDVIKFDSNSDRNENVKLSENYQKIKEKILKMINLSTETLFDNSIPTEEKIRTGSARNYIKTLQKLFETSNNEIRKSLAFKKLMKQRRISIPLPCDVKC